MTYRQNEQFKNFLVSDDMLDQAVEWISGHLNPSDVFEEKTLSDWALNNGFVEES